MPISSLSITAVNAFAESFIYQALHETGISLRYIYVKDLSNPDKFERTALGNHLKDIQKRSHEKYNTFIALPIRSGQPKDIAGGAFTARETLGMLGIDRKQKYSLGNFEEHEQEYLACFVDMMSELAQDLIGSEAQNVFTKATTEKK